MTRWYGDWAGDPLGVREDTSLCAAEVWPNTRGPIPHQCGRKRPADKLLCKQHEARVERVPEDETTEATKARVLASRERIKKAFAPNERASDG